MRLTLDLDDDLLAAAMRAGPYKTKKAAVEAGLTLLVKAARRDLLALRGALRWDGGAQRRPRRARVNRTARPE